MARGKHAIRSDNRRVEAAHALIDRLTTELANAKIRYRQAEERAERTERVDRMMTAADARHDEMLSTALEKLAWWERVAKDDRQRRVAALREVFTKLVADVRLPGDTPIEDRRQFLETRYPDLMNALVAGAPRADGAVYWSSSPFRSFEAKLGPEDLRRFQRLSGERSIVKDCHGESQRDAAEVWVDLLEARQAGFSKDEILEYVGVSVAPRAVPDPPPHDPSEAIDGEHDQPEHDEDPQEFIESDVHGAAP